MICSFVLAIMLAVGGGTQAKPDFSGQWTIEPATAPARGRSGDMGSGWGPTIRITQSAQQLIVEYAFFGRGDMQPPMKFTYALDGTETKNSFLAGHGMQEERSKAVWNGDSLVITTSYTFIDPSTGKATPTTTTQTLSLSSPTSLVVDVVRAGVLGGKDTTTKTTYKKSPIPESPIPESPNP